MKEFCRRLLWVLLPLLAVFAVSSSAAGDEPDDRATHYQVTVLGDVHFDGEKYHLASPASSGRETERKRNLSMWAERSNGLLKCAGNFSAGSSAFAIQLGDISQGDCDNRELHKAMLKDAFAAVKRFFPDMPLLVVKGNHDVRSLSGTDSLPANEVLMQLVARELGRKKLADGSYVYRRGPDLYIAVDGFLSAKEVVSFVKKALADNPDTRYVILLSHLPVLPVSGGKAFWLLPGHEKIRAMLAKRRGVILCAHTHTFSLVEAEGAGGRVVQLVTTSMGNAWSPGHKLVVAKDWAQYRAAIGKKFAEDPEALKQLKRLDDFGQFSGRIFKGKSGFTILDVDDRRIEARIYTDDSKKPALSAVLVENR